MANVIQMTNLTPYSLSEDNALMCQAFVCPFTCGITNVRKERIFAGFS